MPKLSAGDVVRLRNIHNMTRTIEGVATNEPCWSWALYGGGAPQDPADLFAIANVKNFASGLWPEQRIPYRNNVLLAARAPGHLSEQEIDWALRQSTKGASGGKYTIDYFFQKIVKRAIERAGLRIASTPGEYFVCMHAPIADGLTYEHWWLEVHGYTIEKFPLWRTPYIYRRGPEANHYRAVRIPIAELHQRQVDRISTILRTGEDKATLKWS